MTSSNNITASDRAVCPMCGGEGQIEVEVAVIDHMDGGYLKEAYIDCEFCDGNGEVDADDAAEFTFHIELDDGPYYH